MSLSLPPNFTPPLLSQLELLRLHARRAFLGTRQGGHLSPKRGHGIEFSDYRQYELGDNPRHIDWGVFARTDRLYVKRFREEQDLNVLIILDTSASMVTPASDQKWERARDIALAIAYVALMQQDSVLISALGGLISPRVYGGGAIHSLSRLLDEVRGGEQSDFAADIMRAASRIRFPGVAVVLSDYLMPFETIEAGFNILRSRNLDITALQVLGPHDVNPLEGYENAIAIDSENGEEVTLTFDAEARKEYTALLDQHTSALREYFANAQIGYGIAHAQQDFTEFVQEILPRVGLFRS